MRSGEALAMRTCDLDTSGKVWVYTPEHHKGEHHEKECRVLLSRRAQAIVTPWLRPVPTEYLFQPREAQEEHHRARRSKRITPLTPSQRARVRKAKPQRAPGERYDPRTYAHAVERACRQAGVPHWHPHQLRHNAATHFREKFGLDVARILLSHSSPTVTEIYAEMDMKKAIEAVEQLP
jgi:integrase